jgi:DNA-binding NtrC family response regulator
LRLVYSAGRVQLPPPSYALGSGQIRLGRGVPDGVLLPHDQRASRHHASVLCVGDSRPRIVDHDSRNGTYVNGERISAQTELAVGDVISVGDSCILVCDDEPPDTGAPIPGLLGSSAAVRKLRRLLRTVAAARTTVLLLAESGCGKEVAARALHGLSGLTGELIAVNCSAIPESLAESQLFGHVAGAFTGATAQRGLFRSAHHGTLLFDEVGELQAPLQPKLLRALEEKVVLPVGATTPVVCDVRFIAATNRDLAAEVDKGSFRGDLYARLMETQIRIPPLRERKDDILEIFTVGLGPTPPRLGHGLAEALLLHDWPFNVRELLATARDLRLQAADRSELDAELLKERLRDRVGRSRLGRAGGSGGDEGERGGRARWDVRDVRDRGGRDGRDGRDVRDVRDRDARDVRDRDGRDSEGAFARGGGCERDVLETLLRQHHGVVSKVAESLHRSRRQVYRWLDEYGIEPDSFRS